MKNLNSKYRIDTASFQVSTIGLIGMIDSDSAFRWAMDIYAAEGNYEGHRIRPKFSFTDLKAPDTFTFDKEFYWEKAAAYDEEIDDWVGSFYIFDSSHFDCKIELIKIADFEFKIKIVGKVNMNWETAETQDFKPFEIIQTIPFNGILSEIDDAEACAKIASKYLNIDNLEWHSISEQTDWEDSWFLPKKSSE